MTKKIDERSSLKLRYGQLLELAKRDEGQQLDFKEKITLTNAPPGSKDPKIEFAKDCEGFANASGGLILVGVQERPKRIVGLSEPLPRQRQLRSGAAPDESGSPSPSYMAYPSAKA